MRGAGRNAQLAGAYCAPTRGMRVLDPQDPAYVIMGRLMRGGALYVQAAGTQQDNLDRF